MISCYRLKGLRHPIFDYNMDFVRRNTHSNTDSNTQTNSGPVPLKLLHVYYNLYNIRVAHKAITTLRWLLTNVKDKDKAEERQQGAVYKMANSATARLLTLVKPAVSRRLTEHKRATRNGDVNNHIAEHHLKTKHQIDWDSATCITYSTDYYQRLTLESWFTNLEQTPLNRSQHWVTSAAQTTYDNLTNNRRLFNCDNTRVETHQLQITSLHSQ